MSSPTWHAADRGACHHERHGGQGWESLTTYSLDAQTRSLVVQVSASSAGRRYMATSTRIYQRGAQQRQTESGALPTTAVELALAADGGQCDQGPPRLKRSR
jgi:hypothetical protein